MQPSLRLRQILRLLGAVVLTLIAGTLGFHSILGDGWFQAFYRSIVRATLSGVDMTPGSDGARVLSILLVLAGLTIIAYAGAVIVEAIAGGVFTGVLAERRRERTIQRMQNHFIICGYGRAAGVPYVAPDFSEQAIATAKEQGDLMIAGNLFAPGETDGG